MSSCPFDVSVIIVSFNTRDMSLRCLQTLFDNSAGLSLEVIVVDNASHDGTVAAIREQFSQVHVIASDENLGFGRANNLAMKQATAPRFLLLNSDAFVHRGALQKLIEYSLQSTTLEKSRIGVVGPQLLNEDGTRQKSCYDFITPQSAWRENLGFDALSRFFIKKEKPANDEALLQAKAVNWVIGACMLVKREVWQEVGGFDEQFFMYAEETDWQQRMNAAGWEIHFLPSAQVTHLAGASGKKDEVRVSRHFFESLDFYYWKHFGWQGLLSLRAAMTIGCAVRTLAWGAASAVPPLRKRARVKSRTMARLLLRQAFHWRLPHIKK